MWVRIASVVGAALIGSRCAPCIVSIVLVSVSMDVRAQEFGRLRVPPPARSTRRNLSTTGNLRPRPGHLEQRHGLGADDPR